MEIRVLQGFIDFLRGKKHFYSFCFPVYHFIKHKLGKSVIVLGNSHANFFGLDETPADFQEAIHIDKFNVGINFCDRTLTKFPKSKFSVFHLDPVLAYNLNKHNTKSLGLEKVEYMINKKYFNKNATIILCFGEIDVRAQVFKQAKKSNQQIDIIINNILKNYLEFLLYLKQYNYKIYCWGVTPSKNVATDISIADISEIEINKAKELFNKKLENICNIHNFGFINIFNKLINPDYTLKENYTFDGYHLNQQAWNFAEQALKNANVL